MLRRVLIVMAALAAFAVMTAPSFAAKGGSGGDTGNKLNAKSCQKDGWKALARSTSPTVAFTSETECTSYAAKKGNTIVALQTATQYTPLSANCVNDPTIVGVLFQAATTGYPFDVCKLYLNDSYLHDQWGEPLYDEDTGEPLINHDGIAENTYSKAKVQTNLSPTCFTDSDAEFFYVVCPAGA